MILKILVVVLWLFLYFFYFFKVFSYIGSCYEDSNLHSGNGSVNFFSCAKPVVVLVPMYLSMTIPKLHQLFHCIDIFWHVVHMGRFWVANCIFQWSFHLSLGNFICTWPRFLQLSFSWNFSLKAHNNYHVSISMYLFYIYFIGKMHIPLQNSNLSVDIPSKLSNVKKHRPNFKKLTTLKAFYFLLQKHAKIKVYKMLKHTLISLRDVFTPRSKFRRSFFRGYFPTY